MKTVLTIFAFAGGFRACRSTRGREGGAALYGQVVNLVTGRMDASNANIAKALKVEMKDLKAPEVQATSEADFQKIITMGKGKMQPVAAVTGPGASRRDCLRS